jgi:hypothetical protein
MTLVRTTIQWAVAVGMLGPVIYIGWYSDAYDMSPKQVPLFYPLLVVFAISWILLLVVGAAESRRRWMEKRQGTREEEEHDH